MRSPGRATAPPHEASGRSAHASASEAAQRPFPMEPERGAGGSGHPVEQLRGGVGAESIEESLTCRYLCSSCSRYCFSCYVLTCCRVVIGRTIDQWLAWKTRSIEQHHHRNQPLTCILEPHHRTEASPYHCSTARPSKPAPPVAHYPFFATLRTDHFRAGEQCTSGAFARANEGGREAAGGG
jgi:hypothetical protein